ncbi:2-oxoglutarate and iron-dependent oxygenase domain-containing protein [Candidatus Chloroploca asiatica]|uniref:Non-haem dioxygenase N-terminal domain-containing protein n=1 Tax=Candidatus Chloroploca asiatica TaxID=1506545 RepID=A0A2H3KS01_9CHLR|nr:2-oxoglutarate and iron-dependent oxygenase domain-containing protein [Candidatus Chloroploca asiatica]PDW00383.1 hypothetical protein A9Q02_21815 [Candidatus Chloroploca asiatica]
MTVTTYATLPVLDLVRLEADPEERAVFLDEVRRTAYELGFFYVTGHGVDPELIRQVLAHTRQFFALPEAEKLAIAMANSPHFRGYNRKGQEYTRGQQDWREQVDFGPERAPLPDVAQRHHADLLELPEFRPQV